MIFVSIWYLDQIGQIVFEIYYEKSARFIKSVYYEIFQRVYLEIGRGSTKKSFER